MSAITLCVINYLLKEHRMIDFRKEAEIAKKYIVEAYGSKGKAIAISRHIGITSTRDGKEIIEALNPNHDNVLLNELSEVGAFTESMSGDGTSSSILAFINAINYKNKSPLCEKEILDTINLTNEVILNNKVEITKKTIHDFVNTSCAKTISSESLKEIANIIEQSRFKADRHLYVSDNLMSDPYSAINGSELKSTINQGFSFDYNTSYALQPTILRQLESNWIVSFIKGELSKDALHAIEISHSQSVSNIDSPVSSSHKVLLICRSFSPEISEYFSRTDPSKVTVFPIILPRKTMNDADELIDCMMTSTGVLNTMDDLIYRSYILNKWLSGKEVNTELDKLVSRSGYKGFSELYNPTFKESITNILATSGDKTIEKKKAELQAMTMFAKLLNIVGGNICTGSSVNTLNISKDCISIIGCENRNPELVNSVKAKNIETLNKSTDASEKRMCLVKDMILSMDGSCCIMVYDHVGAKRVVEIRDSLKDVISSAACIKKHMGHFVIGGFYTINKIIDALYENKSKTDIIVANILEELLSDFLSTYNNAGKNFDISNKKDNNTIDSSESIKCIIHAIFRGINFSVKTSENIINCK